MPINEIFTKIKKNLKNKTYLCKMKEYQYIHDTPEYIKEHYPVITLEQVEALIELGEMRRFRKLKKPRTMYVNEKNGAVLYYEYTKEKFQMCYYFIDPEHPKEIEYQNKIKNDRNK